MTSGLILENVAYFQRNFYLHENFNPLIHRRKDSSFPTCFLHTLKIAIYSFSYIFTWFIYNQAPEQKLLLFYDCPMHFFFYLFDTHMYNIIRYYTRTIYFLLKSLHQFKNFNQFWKLSFNSYTKTKCFIKHQNWCSIPKV